MFESITNQAKEKLKDLDLQTQTNVGHLARFAVRDKDKIKEVTEKDRLISAAIAGLSGLAASIVFPKLISRFTRQPFHFPFPVKATITAGGALAGYSGPDVRNILIKEKMEEISKDEARKLLHGYTESENERLEKFQDIIARPQEKTAGVIRSVLGGAARGGYGLVREGLRFGKKRPLGTRIWSGAFKTGLVGGGIYGAGKGISRFQNRSRKDYTTFLRNQVLAGNVHPDEISQNDLVSVRRLGMN